MVDVRMYKYHTSNTTTDLIWKRNTHVRTSMKIKERLTNDDEHNQLSTTTVINRPRTTTRRRDDDRSNTAHDRQLRPQVEDSESTIRLTRNGLLTVSSYLTFLVTLINICEV